MSDDQKPNKARVIKASTMLQAKVGTGTIDEEKIRKMQRIMDQPKTDFVPMALQLLDELAAATANARQNGGDPAPLLSQMTIPVMQLKAHAAMFNYPLVGDIARNALDFLENVTTADKGVIDIIDAHHRALGLVIKGKLSGDGGAHGKIMESELKDACSRYFTKKSADAFYVG